MHQPLALPMTRTHNKFGMKWVKKGPLNVLEFKITLPELTKATVCQNGSANLTRWYITSKKKVKLSLLVQLTWITYFYGIIFLSIQLAIFFPDVFKTNLIKFRQIYWKDVLFGSRVPSFLYLICVGSIKFNAKRLFIFVTFASHVDQIFCYTGRPVKFYQMSSRHIFLILIWLWKLMLR